MAGIITAGGRHHVRTMSSSTGRGSRFPAESPAGGARRITLDALARRVDRLEQLVSAQGHELRIQFERIAQLQAERDILRIRYEGRGDTIG